MADRLWGAAAPLSVIGRREGGRTDTVRGPVCTQRPYCSTPEQLLSVAARYRCCLPSAVCWPTDRPPSVSMCGDTAPTRPVGYCQRGGPPPPPPPVGQVIRQIPPTVYLNIARRRCRILALGFVIRVRAICVLKSVNYDLLVIVIYQYRHCWC